MLAYLVFGVLARPALSQAWLPASVYPTWAAAPSRTITLDYDSSKSDVENGARLAAALRDLVPGDGLAIGSGRWSVVSKIDLTHQGSAERPIWIYGKNPASRPVITRPDASQNCLNLGESRPCRYVILRDLEITGGSYLLNMLECDHIWVHRCYIHDGGGVGISTQRNCSHIHITNNEVANPGPGSLGEGMYIGTNSRLYHTTYSVIAYNHVHDTRSSLHGDGIELKQGCHHNWIIGNLVHDTKYPCILVYGTDDNDVNVIERNICRDSDNEVLQVQGDAIVRDNICMGGVVAFTSGDHVERAQQIQVLNNTFINEGNAVSLSQWSGRPNMVFANNACYSRSGNALRFGQATTGVTVAGNVVFGATINLPPGADLRSGTGLEDFVDTTWDGSRLDVRPVIASPLDGRALVAWRSARDASGNLRSWPSDIGALESAASFVGDIARVSAASGGEQKLSLAAGTSQADRIYLVVGTLGKASPGFLLAGYAVPVELDLWFSFTVANANRAYLGRTLGLTDDQGRASAILRLPPLPVSMRGAVFGHAAILMDGVNFNYVSNRVDLSID